MSAVFDAPSLWQRAAAGVHRLRRAARRSPIAAARRRRPGDDVLGRLRPRHALRRPRPQHAARARRAVRRRADPAAAADALAVPLYVVGVALLVATALPGIGITKKGATRWLNVGVVIQPSEILKIAMPLMLAWWFQRREGQLRALDFVIAGAAAAGAGRPDRQAARPRHRDPGAVGRPVRDLLRRAVVEADRAGAGARRASAITAIVVVRGRDLPARRQVADAARLPEEPRLHPARPDHRPARQGLPHHPGDDRDRLGRHRPARAS